jgi:hypothetical protein
MRLGEIQRLFHDAVRSADDDSGAIREASLAIVGSASLPAREHLLIYRRAVLGTLTRALTEIYPVCRRLTGAEFFDALSRDYARRTVSRSPDLGAYGECFADFIAGFEPARVLPYLADVARLEWCWHRAFHAADCAPFDPAGLAAVEDERQSRIRLALHPSASLLASGYPVHRIWEVNQPEHEVVSSVSLDEGGVRLVVWRQQYDMRIDLLDEREWWLLDAVRSGATLGALSDSPDLPTLLPRCITRGWIAAWKSVDD